MPRTNESGAVQFAFAAGFLLGLTGAEAMELVDHYATLVVAHDELMAERDALVGALMKADKQLGAAPVLNAYSAGAWQTIRAALERTP